jgi:DNA-binding NarL/FixJ family response regulator
MDRDELARMVEAGLTVRQIADRSRKGYSTIRY